MFPNKSLEFFFGEVPPFVTLSARYPHLTKLTIVGQEPLNSLRGLDTLPELRELWVIECGLRQITHLENAGKLEKLYLYSNRIEVIDGLGGCAALTTLWLDDNRITEMAGLQQLKALRYLNLAHNKVSRLAAVDWGDSVEWLNLSGNPLPLTDLTTLARLPRLAALHLQDAMYRPAACTRLCNFRLFCVLLMPRLQQLDGCPVTEHERSASRQHLASRLVYYRALCRHVRARCQQQVQQLRADWADFLAAMSRRIRLLHAKRCQLEQAAETAAAASPAGDASSAAAAESPASEETLAAFRQAILRRQECVTSVVRSQSVHSNERLHMLTRRRRLVQALLELEYRTVGNIRCEELHVAEGVGGSAGGGGRAMAALSRYLGRDRLTLSGSRHVHLMAMYKVNNRFLENMIVQSTSIDRHARVLDRFITLADFASEANSKRDDVEWIMEVCKGNVITALNVRTDLDTQSEEVAAPRPMTAFSYFGCFHEAMLVQMLTLPQGKTTPAKVPAVLDANNEELQNRRMVIAPKFVLLYTIGESYSKPMTCLTSVSLDDDLLNSVCLPETEVPGVAELAASRPGGAVLSAREDRVLAPCRDIVAVESVENSANVVDMDLSSNDLHTLEFLKSMHSLTTLNISFNRIETLRELPRLPSLKELDISWNRLHNLPETLRRLSVASPRLKALSMGFNPWWTPDEQRPILVAALLPALEQLSEPALSRRDPVTPTFRLLQCPMEIGDLVLPHTGAAIPWANMPTRLDPRKLTAVCLDGQLLQNLRCIRDITFLQKLSLNDNLLRSLQGLEAFPHLEYLSADFNELTSVQGLALCSMKLRSLSVRYNSLAGLGSLETVSLPALELLDVSGNPVASLAGVERLRTLTELYVTGARLGALSSLSPLSAIARLQALDMCGNPVCSDPNYRRFSVYKASTLQILDGGCVADEERAEAISALSGLLTPDRLMELLPAPALPRASLTVITQLDLPGAGLREINLPTDCLQQLVSLNLEDNELTLLSGLQHLRRLRVLNLCHNAVRRLRERNEPPPQPGALCFPALMVLLLAGNGLTQLGPLQLTQLRALHALYVHDNQLKVLDSVEKCTSLQLLVADRNQLQLLPAAALVTLTNLRALHVEGNRLRRLPQLWPPRLRALFLANNKLSEPLELTRLSGKLELSCVTLFKNPLTRNVKWQAILCASQPSLQLLDGCPVTDVLGSRPGLDGDGDSADDEDGRPGRRGGRSVWWRPQRSTTSWNFRADLP